MFDLLEYLIRNRERVVSKDDLINTVWNGRIVSDDALTTRLNAARTAIGDTGEKQRLIKTLPRKGFRLVGTVQEAHRPAIEPVGSAAQNGNSAPSPLSAPRLSIVVLPLVNLSGDPEQDYFVDGVTESLTTDLSRISGSFVIGRHTAFTYKGRAGDLKQIGRELNIRYVLEGSVQRSGNWLRVNVQLVDAETASHHTSGLEGAVIKQVLDHVVNGPTVGRIESAGCLAGLFALCSGIDCIQIKKLTDTAHGNKQGWVFVLRRHRCFAKPFCAFLKIRGGLVICEEEKLRVKIAAQIVVRDQLLYCLNHELAAGQPRFMVGCEPLSSERFYGRFNVMQRTL